MFAWMKGQITRMVISSKISTIVKILQGSKKMATGPMAAIFHQAVDQTCNKIGQSIDVICADEARLVRLTETWIPVLESIKIAWDLSSDDVKALALELKPIIDNLSEIEPSDEITTEGKSIAAEITAAVEELKL